MKIPMVLPIIMLLVPKHQKLKIVNFFLKMKKIPIIKLKKNQMTKNLKQSKIYKLIKKNKILFKN
jgi:hypothetical protein